MKDKDVEDMSTAPLSVRLKEHGIKLSAVKVNRKLMGGGIIEECQLFPDGDSESEKLKMYKRLTEKGEYFGVNVPGRFGTVPEYYAGRFKELLVVLEGIDDLYLNNRGTF